MAKAKNIEKIKELKVRAIAKYIRVSAFKVRPVIDSIVGMPVPDAKNMLEVSPKGVASHVLKVLNSATANAQVSEKLKAKPEELVVAEAYVNEGPTLKRVEFRAMGRVNRIRKRTSHITVIVSREGEE